MVPTNAIERPCPFCCQLRPLRSSGRGGAAPGTGCGLHGQRAIHRARHGGMAVLDGAGVGLWSMVSGTVFLLAPFCLVSGLAFSLWSQEVGGTAAYVLETLGGVAGGLA